MYFDLKNIAVKKILSLLAAAGLLACNPQSPSDILFELSPSRLLEANSGASLLLEADAAGDLLRFAPAAAGESIRLAGAMPVWKEAAYLVLEVQHDNSYSAILFLDFYRSGQQGSELIQQGDAPVRANPRISAKIGVLPHLPTQVIFPLHMLDAQEIFMPRFPRQLKGTVMGSRLEPSEISELRLRIEPWEDPEFRPELTIRSFRLVKDHPGPLSVLEQPVVDAFGQWTARDWPGKIRSEEQLHQRFDSLKQAAAGAAFPEEWSRYGGLKAKRFGATGYFRTHHDGERWWLVDPEGCAFISMGVDCVRPWAEGMTSGQEDLFEWLPAANEAPWAEAWGERRGQYLFDFSRANLIRAFGEQWRPEWEALTRGLMLGMAFNTVANWSDEAFARRSGIPYMIPMRDFPGTQQRLFRDFPDVFSDEYAANCRSFASQLEDYQDDPWLIGYFLSNEPHWAFGYHNLAFEMYATPAPSATKQAFKAWISERYNGDADAWSAAWGKDYTSFDALDALTLRDLPNEQAGADFYAFSEVMVKKYIDVVCDAVEAVDPNHLNLGMRYAWISSDLLYRAGERFDVFSINGYSAPGPPETAEIAARSGKPVMIGEYHFGALDAGLPASGIQGVASQDDRGRAYRYYLEQGFARPELIGIHYFQWLDQPVFGRFDGENYNIGLLDIAHLPYAPLAEAARSSHLRAYGVAAGTLPPFDAPAVKKPAIYY